MTLLNYNFWHYKILIICISFFFSSNSSRSSINSPGTLGPSTMANPYTMGSIYHSPSVQSYCGPTENLSLAGHYSDMRTSASWYGTTANDPRFASK